MATELRLRRGNTAATSTFVGAEGEVTINTSNDSLVVHDGVTAGGFEAARADLNNVTNATFAAKALAANIGGNITGNITGASTTATYITIGSDGGLLPNSRRLQAGSGTVLADGGSGGAITISANLANTAPSNLGSAAVGASTRVARADHVHQMPTANDVGAASKSTYIIAGNGLTGTANLSSNVSLSLNANLNNLGDVYTTNTANGDILVYNSATSQWNNTQNFPRLTTRSNGTLIGSANTVSTLNFIAGPGVTVTSANATQTNISINTIYSQAEIQNYAGGVISSGINGGITASYDTVNKRANFSANAFTVAVTGAVTGSTTISNLANATISTTLPQNSVQLGFHTTGSYIANAIAGLGMSASYNANVATMDVNVSSGHFTIGARDAISTGFNNGNHGGIGVVYNRTANAFSFSANTFTVTLAGAVTGQATSTNLSNIVINTVNSANGVTLSSQTNGDYLGNVIAGNAAVVTYTGGTAGRGMNATMGVNVADPFFTMGARDAISTGFNNGTQTGVSVVYNRTANAYSITANTFTVSLTGPIFGTNVVTGLSNVAIQTQIAANSVALGTHTTGNYVAGIGVSGTGLSIAGSGSAGATPTITVNSTNNNTGSTIVSRDSLGNFSANTITAYLTGLASDNVPSAGGTMTGALTLNADPINTNHAATKRYVDNAGANTRIIMTGDVTANALAGSLTTTLSTTGVIAGTYKSVVVDSKGRVTAGSNPTTLSGYGITDAVATSGAQTVGGDKNFSNNVTVGGNLVVQGSTFTINSSNVSISDKTFTVAKDATSSTTADQAGLLVAGANASWLYDNTTNGWMSNKNVVPSVTDSFDIGTSVARWRNAFLSGNLTVAGTINAQVSGSVTTAGNISGGFNYSIPYQTGTSVTAMLAAGTAGYLLTTNGGASAPTWTNPSSLSVSYASTAGSATTVTSNAQPNITSVGTLAGLTTSAAISPSANASVNLGSTSAWFNNVYGVSFIGTSTTAKYADLAEKYTTDRDYAVGTVIAVGGSAEATACVLGDRAFGVISEFPAYLMNSESEGQAVALKGRVPVLVTGAVRKGQRLIAGPEGTAVGAGAHFDTFAIALETNDDEGVKLVEAIIL